MRKISMLAAACILAGSAWAQQDNPSNPHSTKNKDQQTNAPPSDVRPRTADPESATPGATDSRSDSSKPGGSKEGIEASERENPHHADARNRAGMAKSSKVDSSPATPETVLQRLHVANTGEIAMGELAQQNGSARVQEYGKTLVTDHKANDKQVRDLAGKKNVTLSSTPSDPTARREMQDSQKMHDQLAKLNGQEFDRAFARAMTDGHRKVLAEVQMWTNSVKDPDTKSLLDQTLPVLQQHLRTAESLRQPAAQGRSPQ